MQGVFSQCSTSHFARRRPVGPPGRGTGEAWRQDRRRLIEFGMQQSRKIAGDRRMAASGAGALSIRCCGGHHEPPDRCRSPLLSVDPRQAAGTEHDLRHGRLRHGRVFRFLHAEPILPGASAASGGGPRSLQLPNSVRDEPDPLRQSDPRHARSGRAEAIPSRIRRRPRRTGTVRCNRPTARSQWPCADRAGWL